MSRLSPNYGTDYEDPEADPIRDVIVMYESNFQELYDQILELQNSSGTSTGGTTVGGNLFLWQTYR